MTGIAARPTTVPMTVNGRRLPHRERILSLKMPVGGETTKEHSARFRACSPETLPAPGQVH